MAVQQEIDLLVENWRKNSLSGFCTSCNDKRCCRSNFEITREQGLLIFGQNFDELDSGHDWKSPVVVVEGKYRTNFSRERQCPQFQDEKCNIHDNPLYPKTCREFPIFVRHEMQAVYRHGLVCPAVEVENALELFESIMGKGYAVKGAFCWDVTEIDIAREKSLRRVRK